MARGCGLAHPADSRLLSPRMRVGSPRRFAVAQPADAGWLTPPIRGCSARGCGLAHPADSRLLSLRMRVGSPRRFAVAQPADAGGRIEPGVERFRAEPQDLAPKTI